MNDSRALSRRSFIGTGTVAAAAVAVAAAGGGGALFGASAALAGSSQPLINPVVPQRADPWLMKHTDGRYYFTASVPEYNRLIVRSSPTIEGLGSAPETVVWTRPAAGDSSEVFRVRIYVMSTADPDPATAVWEPPVRVHTHADTFALDATTFEHAGTRYLLWAQGDAGVNSSLFIASMSSPSVLSSAPVRIAVPTLDWETRGYKVNEGAAVIKRNGRIFVSFSASATDANYCMGLLTASDTADLLDPASWVKTPNPVFSTNEGSKQYGPGHNSFTVDEAGNDVLVYHARSYRAITGDPLYDPNRHARVQRLYWNADGTPDFGVPVGDGALPVRLEPASVPGSFLAHDGVTVAAAAAPALGSSQFRLAPGYAKKNSVVIEPVLAKDHFLRIAGSTVAIAASEGTSSAFLKRGGLSDSAGTSFESVDQPGAYLVLRNGVLAVGKVARNERSTATFFLRS